MEGQTIDFTLEKILVSPKNAFSKAIARYNNQLRSDLEIFPQSQRTGTDKYHQIGIPNVASTLLLS